MASNYVLLLKKTLHVSNPCYALHYFKLDIKLSILVFIDKLEIVSSPQHRATS